MRFRLLWTLPVLTAIVGTAPSWSSAASPELAAELDRALNKENAGKELPSAPAIDDLAFLRRVTVDLIGRIPTEAEIQRYLSWSAAERRGKAVDALMTDGRFTDRWTIFFADMLRLRANATGGGALTVFVHKALEANMPYDAMCRQLISASGKANDSAEVGFILGDDADPMVLAGVTSQVFMGIRIACAQCHNHPFDQWTREEFYGLAAFFGKTRRVESRLTKVIYTTEADDNTIMWPPEDKAQGKPRKAVNPRFPFVMDKQDGARNHIARFQKVRSEYEAKRQPVKKSTEPSLDDLLSEANSKVQKQTDGVKTEPLDVAEEARKAARELKVKSDLYKASKLRHDLAEQVANPRNRAFARNLVNRLWADLVGRGFVEPVDDFRGDNKPSHPATLDFLAEEFVASGFDFRAAVRLVVTSEAYQRGHLPADVTPKVRAEAEKAFVATPVRRMLSEVLYDSIVQAGHLFDIKYPAGANSKTLRTVVREAVPLKGDPAGVKTIKPKKSDAMAAMPAQAKPVGGYDLETAIELQFDPAKAREEALKLEMMRAASKEELEAERMMAESRPGRRVKYVDRIVEQTIDDNPKFISSGKMATPAPDGHFLRVFGQPTRDALGDHRDHSPSMRQALMMLNGKLTHEASRVGSLEPIQPLLVGPKANLDQAINLAYRETLTREPSKQEMSEAKEIIAAAGSPTDGMADLRWVLLNCHEFRFLP